MRLFQRSISLRPRVLFANTFGIAIALTSGLCSYGFATTAGSDTDKETANASVSVMPLTPKNWDTQNFGKIPVQAGGRVKPLDSLAREIVLSVTGARRFEGWHPDELILSWMTDADRWEDRPFIQVTRKDVKTQIGLDPERSRFSPRELVETSYLAQYAEKGGSQSDQLARPPLAGGAEKEDPRQKELNQVMNRVTLYRSITTGDGWPVVPAASTGAPWGTLFQAFHMSRAGGDGLATSANASESERVVWRAYLGILQSYLKGDEAEFQKHSLQAFQVVSERVPGWQATDVQKNSLEVWYNRTRPFMYAWIFYLGGAIAMMMGAWLRHALGGTTHGARWNFVGRAVVYSAFLLQLVGITVRSWVAGRPPVTNMYESLVWVSFGTFGFAWVLYLLQKRQLLLVVGAIVAGLMMIVADAAPTVMDPGIHPLVPVLRSNYWLTIHVLTITLGYAAFALTLGIANVTLYHYIRSGTSEERAKGLGARVLGLNQLTYRALQFGVVLLAAGTILGGIWADYSWGRFWGWDPKEVWALIALLGYVAILHARYTGWVGQFGFAVWTIVSFLLVVMAWYGVNFILGVGLHSYGFSGSAGQGWVALFSGIQLAFIGAAVWARKRKPVVTTRG